jgi:hypothetical protein
MWRNHVALQVNTLIFKARRRRRRSPSATRVLRENTTDCLGWAASLERLLELVPQIREIIRMEDA